MVLLTRTRFAAALVLLSFNFFHACWANPPIYINSDALKSGSTSDNSVAGTAGGEVLVAQGSSESSQTSSETGAPQTVSPVSSLWVSNEQPKQGQTIEITYRKESPGDDMPDLQFNKESYKLLPAAGGGRCLLGIPADIKPGKYKIQVGNLSKMLTVGAGKFGVQYLTLPKTKDNFIMSPGEEAAVDEAKKTVSIGRAWTGNFQPPCKARISAGFGLRRVVNGKLLSDYFHSGLDYRAGYGAPVKAVAPGKVILARTGYRLHGNMVSIDHGEGVVTFYIHLSKVLVKEGQLVKQGDVIGKVGATGRASGPHLHFSLYVNHNATNPNAWYAKAF